MTHKRKVYLRKKEKSFIFECKTKGKTTFIWTLPNDYEKFLRELAKSSFFSRDKANKILMILASADYKDAYPRNNKKKVRIMDIVGNTKKDASYFLFSF